MTDVKFIKIQDCMININNINYWFVNNHMITIVLIDKEVTFSITDSQIKQLESLFSYREIK